MCLLRMKKILFVILLFLCCSFESRSQSQLYNYDFEQWINIGTKNEEPYHWHSFKSSTGPFHYLLMQQIERDVNIRPGSDGKYSARIFSKSIVGITANGNVTNGRMNAGSMFPFGKNNNNYTQRDSEFATVIDKIPDSLTLWVCFRTKNVESRGRIMCYIHGDADFVCYTGGWEPHNMICANVEYEFARTSSLDEAMVWKRISRPFQHYTDLCNDPKYILTSFTTNRMPGEGNAGDEMFVDDVYLIYNPVLNARIIKGKLDENEVEIEYYIEGTMSPPNLNKSPNELIVQISSDDFKTYIEIGRRTTDISGIIKCDVPIEFQNKNYSIKVMTTNYPMETILKITN